MSAITWSDKVSIRNNTNVARVNKVTAEDMNEIKASVNALYEGEGAVATYYEQTLTPAEILALNSTPVELIEDPGSGNAIVLDKCIMQLNWNSAAYTYDVLQVRYSGGTVISAEGVLNETENYIYFSQVGGHRVQTNQRVEAYVPSSISTGNSSVTIKLWYRVLDFS